MIPLVDPATCIVVIPPRAGTGLRHAVQPGADRTLCGRNADGMYLEKLPLRIGCVVCKRRLAPEIVAADREPQPAELRRCECPPDLMLGTCPLSYDNSGHARGITRGLTEDERHQTIDLCTKPLPGADPIGLEGRCRLACGHRGKCRH